MINRDQASNKDDPTLHNDWFPNIDCKIENFRLVSQASGPNTKPDPLMMSSLPPEPWDTVHIEFCGPFSLVLSCFLEVDIVYST